MNDTVHEIELTGCTPTPLAGYLKALAVLRLVAEQGGDPQARGCWRDEVFVLRTRLGRDELLRFFLEDYAPTPLVAPWNAGSGFYFQEGKLKEIDPATGKKLKTGKRDQPTEATRALSMLLSTTATRFAVYREVAARSKKCIEDLGLQKAPEAEDKIRLLRMLRNQAPEFALGWIDAATVLTGETARFPPLLGTGGNDGNLDFTNNFIQRLFDLFSVDGRFRAGAEKMARLALFSEAGNGLADKAIGQFSPGQAGGPNSGTGFEGKARVNPWDFVFMLEGSLLLAASAARRLEATGPAGLAAPFTVRSRAATEGSAAQSDDGDARGEVWMPLWQGWWTLDEVAALMGEGRAVMGARPVRDGLDFARAVAKLGVDRGVSAFQRYGFLMRSGKAYLATPLSRVTVKRQPEADLIDELERRDWLARAQRHIRDENAPASIRALGAQLDVALFALTQRPDPQAVQRVLRLVGRIEAQGAISARTRDALPPMPPLSAAWAVHADDGSSEFRIACALASLSMTGTDDGKPLHLGLRPHLVPVAPDGRNWAPESRLPCWGHGSLERNLAALLHRRRLEATRMGTEGEMLAGRVGAALEDVLCFLRGDTDDARIAELMAGLACVERLPQPVLPERTHAVVPPPAYALLKPSFCSQAQLQRLNWLPPDRTLYLPPELPARLAAGDVAAALALAWQRLRALNKRLPGRTPPAATGLPGTRLLAALLMPLAYGDLQRLLNWLDIEHSEADLDPIPNDTPTHTTV
jgi:CRISPR-associated protein Csx17